MSRVAMLALHTLREQLLSRAHHLLIVFGGALIYASLLLAVMAVDQAHRVLLDSGLALIEFFALATAVYGAATSILREMETKTIYLILTRPVSKGAYILGRYAGLMATAAAAMTGMGLLHLALLFAKGWSLQGAYFALLYASWLKVGVVAALATFLALFSTSVMTAVNITAVLWVLGHFLSEAKFLIQKAAGPAAWLLSVLLYLVPNLQLFNLRDRWEAPGAVGVWPLLSASAYALVYISGSLGLAVILFRRKEF